MSLSFWRTAFKSLLCCTFCVWSWTIHLNLVFPLAKNYSKRQKKFCLVPPTFPSSCAILGLLAVLLDCRGEYLKAKSLGLVITLRFDISCCGKSGLWLFWSIRVQSPHEVRTQLRQSRRDLPWWADLILQRVGKCVGRESWLHVKESV